MKTGNGQKLFVLAILAIVLVAFGGCDNFMSKDKSFKESIEKEVQVANAAQISVRVLSVSGQGTTTPSGPTTQKVDVPFNVLDQTSETYGFLEWQAFSTSDAEQKEPLDETVITFTDKKLSDTIATIHVPRNDILIQPKCAKRPKIVSTSPSVAMTGVFKNVAVRIYFSEKIDPASFTFDDGTTTDAEGLFKNLSINARLGNEESYPGESLFLPPTLDEATGKILTLKAKDASAITGGMYITITCSASIKDVQGLTLAEVNEFWFRYGTGNDNTPPQITLDIMAAFNGNPWNGDLINRHFPVPINSVLKLTVDAVDKINGVPGSGLETLNVFERLLKDPFGNDTSETSPSTYKYRGIVEDGSYDFDYTLATSGDGLIQLDVTAVDIAGNTSLVKTYQFYRDTVPPAIAENVTDGKISINNIPGSATNGYYNTASHTLTFLESATDYGIDPYRSPIVKAWYQVVSGSNIFASPAWISGNATLEIPSTFPDGNVTVNAKLQDGVGNESSFAPIGTVKLDTHAPSGTVAISPADIKIISGRNYVDFSDGHITLNLSASDPAGGSGLDSFAYQTTATPVPTVFSAYNSVSDTDLDFSTDGEYTVYVWYKDKAGNISNSPTETTTYVDQSSPLINRFVLNKATEADTSEPRQYSKSNVWYFYIKTTDNPAGPSVFSFYDGTASQSVTIPATSGWTGPDTSGAYTVTMVNRVNNPDSSVTITGRLTLTSSTNQEIPITLWVGDELGNWSLPKTPDNHSYYDTIAPSLSVSVKNAPTTTGNTSVTGSGGEAIKYYNNGSTLYTNSLSGHVLNVGSADTSSGAWNYAISGMGLSAAIPATVFPSATLGTTTTRTKEVPVTLSQANALNNWSVTVRDWADNDFTNTYTMFHDLTAPAFTMRISDASVTTPITKSSSTVASTAVEFSGYENKAYKALKAFTFGVTASSDAGSGVKSGTTSFTLNRLKKNGSEVNVTNPSISLASNGIGSTSVSIPTAIAGGTTVSLSGRYFIEMSLGDNLTNTTIPQRIGFVYDERSPYVAGIRARYSDNTVPIERAEVKWTKGDELFIDARATDRLNDLSNANHDPDGSGIEKVTVLIDDNNDETFDRIKSYAKSTNATFSNSDPITYDPENVSTWFAIGLNESGTSVLPSFGSTFTGNIKVTFTDLMENTPAESTVLQIKTDTSAPAISGLVIDGTVYGQAADILYLPPSGNTLSASIVDTNGSGVKAWYLKVAGTQADAAVQPSLVGLPVYSNDTTAVGSYNTSWTTYALGNPSSWQKGTIGVTHAVADTVLINNATLFPDGQARYIRLWSTDYLDNVSSSNLLATQKYQLDATAPVVSLVSINNGDEATNSTDGTVTVTFTVNDAGSGINTLNLTGFAGISSCTYTGQVIAPTLTATKITYAANASVRNPGGSVAFTVVGKLTGTNVNQNNTVSVSATDMVGNPGTAQSDSIIWDISNPIIGTTNFVGVADKFISAGTVDLTIPFNEIADSESGVRRITISGDMLDGIANPFESVTEITAKGVVVTKGGTNGWTGSGRTITLPSGLFVANSPLVIKGITLKSDFATAYLDTTLFDTAGNNSTPSSLTGFTRDTVKPANVTIAINSGKPWTTSATVSVEVAATEVTSGIKKFKFTGINASAATISGYTTDHEGTDTLVIHPVTENVYPKSTEVPSFEITGLTFLTATNGPHSIGVTVIDAANNESLSTPSSSDDISFDNVPAPAPAPVHLSLGTNEYYKVADKTYYFKGASTAMMFSFSDVTDPGSAGEYSGVAKYRYKNAALANPDSPTGSVDFFRDYEAYPTELDAGVYNFWTLDVAGNYSTTFATVTIAADNVVPTSVTAVGFDNSTTSRYDATAKAEGWYAQDILTVDFTASDAVGIKQYGYSKNGASIVLLPVNQMYCNLTAADEEDVYAFYAYDRVNNASTESVTLTLKKDSTPPSVTAVNHTLGAGEYNKSGTQEWYTNHTNNIIVNLVADDAAAAGEASSGIPVTGYSFTVSGTGYTPPVVSGTTITLKPSAAKYAYTFIATDNCGNVSTVTSTFTLQCDVTPPPVPVILSMTRVTDGKVVDSSDAGSNKYLTNDSSVTIIMDDCIDAASGFSMFEWLAVGVGTTTGGYGTSVTPYTVTLPDNETLHTFKLNSKDNLGNTNILTFTLQRDVSGPVMSAYTVDPATSKTVKKLSGTSYATNGDTVTVTLSATDSIGSVASYTCVPAPASKTDNVITLNATETGTTYTLGAVDSLGNPSTQDFTIVKDLIGPEITGFTETGAASTGSTKLTGSDLAWNCVSKLATETFTIAANDTVFGTALTYTSTAGTMDANELSLSIPNDAVSHTVDIAAKDLLGNPTTLRLTYQRDLAPPDVPVISTVTYGATPVNCIKLGSNYYSKEASVTVTLTAGNDALSGFKQFTATNNASTPVTVTTTGTTLSLTTETTVRTWTIKSVDNFGNETAAGDVVTISLQMDSTDPTAPSVASCANVNLGDLGTPAYSYFSASTTYVAYTQNTAIRFTLPTGADNAGGSGFDHFAYEVKDAAGDPTTDADGIIDLAVGSTYEVFAYDKAGNTATTFIQVNQDTQAPVLPALTTTGGIVLDTGVYVKTLDDPLTYTTNASTMTLSFDAFVDQGGSGIKTAIWSNSDPVNLSAETIAITTSETPATYTLTLTDNVGLTKAYSITVIKDTTAPTCASITATGNFYFKRTSDTAATLYYKAAGTASLTTTDPSGLDEASSSLSTSGGSPITIKDKLGNQLSVTMTYISDATHPVFGDPSREYTAGSKDYIVIAATDTGESGINTLLSTCYYNAENLTTSGTIYDGTGSSTGKWNYSYTKSSKTVDLYYDGSKVFGKYHDGSSTQVDLPEWSDDGTDKLGYFLIVAIDNVGRKSSQVVQRDNTKTTDMYSKVGAPLTASRRGFVPPSGGTVGTGYEYETTSPVNNAWSATGDALIDWQSGFAPTKPMKATATTASLTAKPAFGKSWTAKTEPSTTNLSTGKSIDDLHSIALGEGVKSGMAAGTGTVATTTAFVAQTGDTAQNVSTQLLPDSVIEARVNAFAPLATKFMALRGVRFALDPDTEARSKLVTLVRAANAGDVIQETGGTAETVGDAGAGGVGQPMAGIVPAREEKSVKKS